MGYDRINHILRGQLSIGLLFPDWFLCRGVAGSIAFENRLKTLFASNVFGDHLLSRVGDSARGSSGVSGRSVRGVEKRLNRRASIRLGAVWKVAGICLGVPGMELALLPLIDDAKCFAMVRKLRWPEGVSCPHCESKRVTQRGMNETQPDRQRDLCGGCERSFDDLTDTIFAGHHQPRRVWLLCLYFMGLNLSNRQIARELGLDEDSAHDMATQLRKGIVARQPEVVLSGEVECDEVDVVAGHKGHLQAVKKKGDSAADGA